MEEDLVRLFAGLTDEALLRRLREGGLNEGAQAIASEEAERRGLPLTDESEQLPHYVEYSSDYVQLCRYLKPLEAYLLEGQLKAEGINAHLCGVKTIETDPLWFVAMGGVRVFVPRKHYHRARELLAQTKTGVFELHEDIEPNARTSGKESVKQRFGWAVIVLCSSALAISMITFAYLSLCKTNDPCASHHDIQIFSFAIALVSLPTFFAALYMQLRFRQ